MEKELEGNKERLEKLNLDLNRGMYPQNQILLQQLQIPPPGT